MNEIISHPGAFEDFIACSIHIDYVNEITIMEEETIGLLEDPECVHTGRQYDMFRGRLKNLREMKDIFHRLLGNKQNDLERDQEVEDDA